MQHTVFIPIHRDVKKPFNEGGQDAWGQPLMSGDFVVMAVSRNQQFHRAINHNRVDGCHNGNS
jgi:hypothetical protein